MVMFTVVVGMGESDWSGKLGCLMTNQKPERRDSSAGMNEKSRWGGLAEMGEGYMTLIHSGGGGGGGQKIYK